MPSTVGGGRPVSDRPGSVAGGGRHFVGVQRAEGSPVGQLFKPDRFTGTLLLRATFFMSLLVFYLLTSWLPTLLNSAGQSMTSASLIALMLPIGSTIGAIVIGLLMDRYNPHVVLFCSYVLAACFILGADSGHLAAYPA
jgi:MFS transporter, AAHS family, 4-hydroxybenzoate transporter